MGFFSTLFGTAKVAEETLKLGNSAFDGIRKGLDALHYSKEERDAFIVKTHDQQLKHVELTLKESSLRSVTRRWLAWMIMGSFLFLLVMGAMVYPFNAPWSAYILECAAELVKLVLIVAFFYFGYYGVSNLVKK